MSFLDADSVRVTGARQRALVEEGFSARYLTLHQGKKVADTEPPKCLCRVRQRSSVCASRDGGCEMWLSLSPSRTRERCRGLRPSGLLAQRAPGCRALLQKASSTDGDAVQLRMRASGGAWPRNRGNHYLSAPDA
ncbi:hypothetical protein NDU88_000151 [Pleurodeles waltl]|uniref:Uncharacterized protein n=1 Tax=Pleurodeles waltl TaxID=8319 RepID=A0AAV7UT88_PLEWA|nr:hypothetical protein NDU88_000151 [Pleurodeles waltl]